MSDSLMTRGYLAQYGAALLDQGYNIIPIQPGKKAPGFDGWQNATPSKPQLHEWLANGHKHAGVGIVTKFTPAIDIDVRDSEVADKVEHYIRTHCGDAPVRVGRPPKRLMVFRTDKPFRKMRSTKWRDDFGAESQIEVLCDGQQFVAYHKHPETGKPYTWPNAEENPLVIPARALQVITPQDCSGIIEYFDQLAFEQGWEQIKKARLQASNNDLDNPWVEDTNAIDISNEDLRSRLLIIPNAEDYELWTQIGMALHHQYDGDDYGLSLWHEWSDTADNYDADALDRHWKSFAIAGKKRAPITARYILKLAKEAETHARHTLKRDLQKEFNAAKTLVDWERACLHTRHAELDSLARSHVMTTAKDKIDELTGIKTSLIELKRALSYIPKAVEHLPKWCEPNVYDASVDRFFDVETKTSLTHVGFNAVYDRYAFTKQDILDGRTRSSSTAADIALNHYKIMTVDGCRYMPGYEAIYTDAEGTFANLYTEREIPKIPDTLTTRDKHNLAIVKAHLTHLLNEDDARRLLDWMSYVVQHPGRRINYGVLLQGVEGNGKTFWAKLMQIVMGLSNVRMTNAQTLHSPFTDWTVGQCVICIEEIRLIADQNKHDIINRLKPNITNDTIEVHPKGKAPYNAVNTSNYLLFTNHKDALPLDDNSRRYLILFSKLQDREQLLAFTDAHPTYYDDLYNTLDESPGALRHWLLEHKQSDDFKPKGNAPDTEARQEMTFLSKHEFIQALEIAIRENDSYLLGRDVVVSSALHDMAMARGVEYPTTKTLNSLLSRNGYDSLGRIQIEEEFVTVWVRHSEEFYDVSVQGQRYVLTDKVRRLLKARKTQLESNVL